MSKEDRLGPEWDSWVDQWVRQIITKTGTRVGKVPPEQREQVKIAMGKALIQSGAAIIYEHTGLYKEAAEEIVTNIVTDFCRRM